MKESSKLCPATHRGQNGWKFSCDLKVGHVGPHKAEDYDGDSDAFHVAEWFGWDRQSEDGGG